MCSAQFSKKLEEELKACRRLDLGLVVKYHKVKIQMAVGRELIFYLRSVCRERLVEEDQENIAR